MKRAHAITPTDSAPNKDWTYSKPVVSNDGRSVWLDAMQLPMATAHQAAADERGNGKGWGQR